MTVKFKFRIFSFILTLVMLNGISYAKKFDDKGFRFFNWKNPAPRFSDLGLNLNEVRTIIGDSQLLISHKGRDIELWSNEDNEIREYKNARFVSSLTIFNLPKNKVVDAYFDFKNYPDYIPQYTEGAIVKKEEDDFLVKLKQVYRFLIVTLRADFRYQYSLEETGDYSVLMLDGDVGAGAKRIEFIELDTNSTLVVNTSWVDMDSARFVYRTILKAQPDMKYTAPIGAVAMETEQIKNYIEKRNVGEPETSSHLPVYPKIPIYAKGTIPLKTLRLLSDLGTLVFVHPNQWVNTENGVKNIKFVSSLTQLPGTIEQSKPISGDFTRFNEYFKQAKKVEFREGPNGTEIDWIFKFGLGFIGVGLNYTINFNWQNKNTVLFDRVAGDMDPIYGAWEWLDIDTGNTLLVFTAANRIGEEASWALKLANKIPNVEVMSSIFMGILIVEKQSVWVEEQMKSMNGLARN